MLREVERHPRSHSELVAMHDLFISFFFLFYNDRNFILKFAKRSQFTNVMNN